jgi:hypothetical protein
MGHESESKMTSRNAIPPVVSLHIDIKYSRLLPFVHHTVTATLNSPEQMVLR